eukprot:scaffold184260_cov36-Prasinocladus_malaysianus.AAC.1
MAHTPHDGVQGNNRLRASVIRRLGPYLREIQQQKSAVPVSKQQASFSQDNCALNPYNSEICTASGKGSLKNQKGAGLRLSTHLRPRCSR